MADSFAKRQVRFDEWHKTIPEFGNIFSGLVLKRFNMGTRK